MSLENSFSPYGKNSLSNTLFQNGNDMPIKWKEHGEWHLKSSSKQTYNLLTTTRV